MQTSMPSSGDARFEIAACSFASRRNFNLLAIGASALLLICAQITPALGFLALASLTPALAVIRSGRSRHAALIGFSVGTLAGTPSALWVPAAFGESGYPEPLGWGVSFCLAAWLSGVPMGALFIAARSLRTSSPALWTCGLAAAAFAVEHLASTLPWTVPWLLIGHSQIGVPGLAQLAAIGGVPLVSAVVVALNASLAARWVRRPIDGPDGHSGPLLVSVTAGVTLLALFGVPISKSAAPESSGPTRSVLIVQPNIPVEERWNPLVQRTLLARMEAQTRAALSGSSPALPDFIVWPETTLTTPLEHDETLGTALRRTVKELGVTLIAGVTAVATGDEPGHYRNVALWFDPEGEVRAAVPKAVSVPLIEAGTFLGFASDRLLPPSANGMAVRVQRGPLGPQLSDRGESFGLALCYEIAFPRLVSRRTPRDAAAILNLANDGWLGSRAVSDRQLLLASFRAIENRLPLLRVAHGGRSAWIDRYGRVVEEIPFGTEGTLVASWTESARSTILREAALPAAAILAGSLAWMGCRRFDGRS